MSFCQNLVILVQLIRIWWFVHIPKEEKEATKASRAPLPLLGHNKIQELDKISKELPLLKVLVAAPAASTPLPPTPAPASAPLLPPSLSPAPTSTPASAPLISPATRSAPAQL